MKQILLFATVIVIANLISAQDAGLPPRPYKEAEMKRWTFVCEQLSNAMPKSFKDYTVKADECGSFSWAEFDREHRPLTVINKRNEPIGNHPNFNISYRMNEDSADTKSKSFDVEVFYAQKDDGTFDNDKLNIISAKQSKFIQNHNPFINVTTNVQTDFAKQYETSVKPVKLELPINVFAYLYTFPEGKEVKEEGGSIGTDGEAFYRDKALIIIGKTPKIVHSPACNCTWKEDKIYPQDNATDLTLAPVKNIAVEIYGYENDVRELVQMIDWKALEGLIGK